MDAFLQQFQHLKIQLEEITSATDNFNERNCIGVGGFGKVYKGEVSHSKGRSMAAIKCLDRRHGQGTPEFLKEITTLSRYSHENLISLLGFCYEGDEMILLYEHASRGSLDRHLNSPLLTWSQRLKICLDAAKGLSYLHDPRETHQRLIHCDMKSANILLDDHWNAKVSDFGLSIMGPANEQHSVIVTYAAGTPGYCDPQYAMTHTLTKESDVYSFGVVLFEVLCGMLCCTYTNGRVQQILVPTWIENYNKKKLNDIIFKNPITQPLDESFLEIFSDIAHQCLKESREDRPKMAEVVKELEAALESQEFNQQNPLFDYEEMAKTVEPPLKYRSKVDLWKHLSKGVLIDGGKTWFSLNKKGEHCEMISFLECLDSEVENNPWSFRFNSRFIRGHPYHYDYKVRNLKAHVRTQFLSPGITYTVNLVFMLRDKITKSLVHIPIKHKPQGDTKTSVAYFAYKREDGLWMSELYQFTSNHGSVDLEILFHGFYQCDTFIEVEGIEFVPLEKVEDKDEKLDMQPISESDANWEEKLPIDYEDILKWSKNSVQWTTKKEAYSIICKGFLINDGQEWFSLDKNGKKCYMLCSSSRVAYTDDKYGYKHLLSLTESRFGVAVQCTFWTLKIDSEVQSQLVSPRTTYACYLVYKLPKDQCGFEAPIYVVDKGLDPNDYYIYLVSPQTPVIRPKADQKTHNPVHMPKIKCVPQHRTDGWMEVQIWEFKTHSTTEMIPIRLVLNTCCVEMLNGLIIEGIELRPV